MQHRHRGTAPDSGRVRAAVERLLPRVMVPSSYFCLFAMPLTPNGKLDRKALPAPPREEARQFTDHPPETELEREIARIWEDVLRSAVPSVNSDFFDLGANSLALLNLFAVIKARFGRHLSVDVLSGGFTILKLAQLLTEDEAPQAAGSTILALQPRGHRRPFFCAPASAATFYICTVSACIWRQLAHFSLSAGPQKALHLKLSGISPRVTWLQCWHINPLVRFISEATVPEQ
jgi:Phosphopantetheine attachment site